MVPPTQQVGRTHRHTSSRAACSSSSSKGVGRMRTRCTLSGGGGGPVKPEASVAVALVAWLLRVVLWWMVWGALVQGAVVGWVLGRMSTQAAQMI